MYTTMIGKQFGVKVNNYGVSDFIADIGGQWGPVDDPNVNNYSSPASHGDIRGLLATDQGVAALTHNCER